MPDIIPGGIYGGIFTPKQTVAVAVPLCAGGRHDDLPRNQPGQFGCDAARSVLSSELSLALRDLLCAKLKH